MEGEKVEIWAKKMFWSIYSGTSERKLVSNNILVTAEVISAGASAGCILQLIPP